MPDVRPKVRGILILDDGVPVPFMYNPDELDLDNECKRFF
jgi:hypothetical protein